MIEQSIQELIQYGIEKELITSEDEIFLRNQLMDLLQLSAWETNTLYLADCYVSEAILPELADTGRFEVFGPLRELAFDAQGNLISCIGLPDRKSVV